jgi:Papain-like cysteine protease AvrRpt2
MTLSAESQPELQTGQHPSVSFVRIKDRLSGVESLDLSVAEPVPTAHLKLLPQKDAPNWFSQLRNFSAHLGLSANHEARFQSKDDSHGKAWQLGTHTKGLPIGLRLPHKHGVVLILDMARTKSNAQFDQPVILTINAHEWPLEIDPHNLKFHKQSWYLPHYLMQEGENILSLRLAPDAETEMLVKSAAVMRFEIEQQKRGNWCWAAVTNSLLSFFKSDNELTQCKIVQECFGVVAAYKTETDCCQHSRRPECNRDFKLVDALDLMGLLSLRCRYPLSLDEIREQINQGVPVAARIAWRGGGAHFVVITAVVTDPKDDQNTWLRVADPKDQAASYVTYQALKHRYKGEGEWTHSYLFEKQRQSDS